MVQTTGSGYRENRQPRQGRRIKDNVRQILRRCAVAIPNTPPEMCACDAVRRAQANQQMDMIGHAAHALGNSVRGADDSTKVRV